jgi:hypothetical protein
MTRKFGTALLALSLAAGAALAQERKPASPRGTAATQVGGTWSTDKEPRYTGGKWIEVDYGRPIKRGREALFGKGPDYAKKVLDGATLWRAGANQTTRLKTEATLEIGGKKLAPGEYSVFVDTKENGWTLVLSTQPFQQKYDNDDKKATWGSYNYDPKFDVLRAPMQMVKSPHSIDEFTIGFLDVTDKEGKLAMGWDKDIAIVHFTVVP